LNAYSPSPDECKVLSNAMIEFIPKVKDDDIQDPQIEHKNGMFSSYAIDVLPEISENELLKWVCRLVAKRQKEGV